MITIILPTSAPDYIVIDGTAVIIKGDPDTVMAQL